jgi:imidazole glycerol-phosphate synthase subunit HisH
VRVTVLDYGVGNLHSLLKALAAPGMQPRAESDALRAVETDVLVLPGVGSFGAAAERIAPARAAIRDAIGAGLPCLGICLGMQLLLDSSEEGAGEGLGIIPGRVRRMRAARVPQMGWNALEERSDPLLDASGLDMAYFANSYVCELEDGRAVRASSVHDGDRFPAVVRAGRTVGVQFHPEKSSRAGVAFISEFLEEARR